MEYREIVAVTGLSGLYQLLTTKSDGAIVRNVADKSTKFISARQHNVTPLDSIEVYTTGENVRLQDVFRIMQEHETTIPLADAKTADNAAIKGYFKGIFPEFDEDRVYVSDMKKMLKWYELLKANDLLHFEQTDEAATEDEKNTGNEAAAVETKEEKTTEIKEVTATEAPVTVSEEVVAEKKPRARKSAKPSAETDTKQSKEAI